MPAWKLEPGTATQFNVSGRRRGAGGEDGAIELALHELSILRQLLPLLPSGDGVALGAGDDCAALHWGPDRLLLAAVDQVIGGVHYLPATEPERVGAKLLKRNLSDIAAMGGIPRWALLTVASGGRSESWVLALARGVLAAAEPYGVALIGGDLAALAPGAEGEVATLTILGEVPASQLVRRSGLRPGDLLYVTGELGNSLATEHHLNFRPRLAEGRFLAERGLARAMLDLSDGLGLDASRLGAASGVALELEPAALPCRAGADWRMALRDGEDYELLFGVAPERVAELESEWPPTLAPLRCIGRAVAGTPGQVKANGGGDLAAKGTLGYEH